MSEQERGDKIQAVAAMIRQLGFGKFIVIAWDDENKWAATVDVGIEPQRLKDAAAFLLKSAGGLDG